MSECEQKHEVIHVVWLWEVATLNMFQTQMDYWKPATAPGAHVAGGAPESQPLFGLWILFVGKRHRKDLLHVHVHGPTLNMLLIHGLSTARTLFVGAGGELFFSLPLFSGRPVLASEAFYLQIFVTPSAHDYYFKDYFKPWVVQFVTFVAKQCWPKLCLLARAGTFAWQHYLIVYSGDTGKSFQLQTTLEQRWLRLFLFGRPCITFRRLSLNAPRMSIKTMFFKKMMLFT